jgi:hypothetical protein
MVPFTTIPQFFRLAQRLSGSRALPFLPAAGKPQKSAMELELRPGSFARRQKAGAVCADALLRTGRRPKAGSFDAFIREF